MPGSRAVARVDEGAVDEIARAYLAAARGDARAALHAVVRDGLDAVEREHGRLSETIRLVSRGYTRGRVDA